ncbi:MAG TPA: gamma-glutamyltransferase [Thermoanaerobaculaceae bacterium]|nr:MAG: gamma-glutamyltransferase [Acidobacteria bacterium 37-71-11]HQU33645.1 gamma-glutamyltransferase [Thermoanaerobaculaceae bacterium]
MIRRLVSILLVLSAPAVATAQMRTEKPPLHGMHWMAITGKPLSATVGAMIFDRGGNAVDAAVAMIAAGCTMWDTLSWGGETQALIYNPKTHKVIGIDALGVAPTGATPEFFKAKGMKVPPEYGPLAAVTPGTPGGIMVMLAEYGTMSLKQVLAPAIEMADGYPIEAQAADTIEHDKKWLEQWPYSRALFLLHRKGAGTPGAAPGAGEGEGPTPAHDRAVAAVFGSRREGPEPGEIFRQPDLAATLRALVATEQEALKQGKSRKQAIYAAYDRFYKGDIAREIARSTQEQGGLITTEDLANWKVKIEEPVSTNYKGIDVYKLTVWTQGPAMLQTLNILENFDLQAMGYDTSRYINTVYQAMSLAFADRDFYYGDPYFPPVSPVAGLLSKAYAKERAKLIDPDHANPGIMPGDPYPFQGGVNPYAEVLARWKVAQASGPGPNGTLAASVAGAEFARYREDFTAGTTSVEAADSEGWVVSVTPSGGWLPAVIAGHTGIGLSQRMQSFDLDPAESPFNVVAPGRRPRVTLSPTLALKDGKPFLCFSVQGGDTQDQNLLQFFLDVTEFGMTVQQATEAANFNSYQMHSSFGQHEAIPSKVLLNDEVPPWVRSELRRMGYTMVFERRTSGPINAILFDLAHGTMWGGSSNHGEDYGIGW